MKTSLDSRLKELQDNWNREMKEFQEHDKLKLAAAQLLTGYAEKAHQEVVRKLSQILPESWFNFSRRVYSNPYLSRIGFGLGCLVTIDEQAHIVIDDRVANLSPSPTFLEFMSLNQLKGVAPIDFLKDVIAHEYAHILQEEQVVGRVKEHLTYLQMNGWFCSPLSINEGFAYWLGNQVSGFDSPVVQLAESYSATIHPKGIIRAYSRLKQHSEQHGVTETLKQCPEILARLEYPRE